MADDTEQTPSLPTYQTVAAVLEKKNGSGMRLAGYTLARTIMIAPPFMALGISPKKAFVGALMASCLMSTFVVLRVFNANFEAEWAAARAAERRGRR